MSRSNRRFTRWVTLLALLAPGLALAQSGDMVSPDAAEITDWRRSAQRVHDRLLEFEADTRAYVDLREREERGRVVRGFDSQIAEYRTLETGQRVAAIEKFEAFLAKYPTEDYAHHVRFRLADLYFEDSFAAYDKAMQEYEARVRAAEASQDLAALESLGSEPTLDLTRSIALYNKILEDNRPLPPEKRYERLDGVYLMLGFCYTDEQSAQQDFGKARDIFADLIATMPDSDLVDRAHLNLGNFLFQYDSQFDAAIAEYQKVYDKGDASPYFEEAIYQLAWSRYKLNQYDQALALFVQLLDISEKNVAETGKASPYAPDAVRFLAFSLADQALLTGTPALGTAEAYFRKIGARPYERQVYVQLADVLKRYTRPSEELDVYVKLQDDPRWKMEPDNPVWQQAVIDLLTTNMETMDLAQGGQARVDLTQRYGQGGEWATANQGNPAAVARARELIEKNLIDVAIEYRVRAQETGEKADYAVAAERYREYLDRFPLSDDYYEQRWNLAATLIQAESWAEAEKELAPLVKATKHHGHDDAVIYSLFETRYKLFETELGPPDTRSPTATIERTYTTPANKQIDVYALPPRAQQTISAADGLLTHEFDGLPVAEEIFRDSAERFAPDIMYLTGQVMFAHNRFDQARPRLQAVIDRYPQTEVASFSAELIVKSYEIEGDLAQVRANLEKYLAMNLGPVEGQAGVKDKLQGALEDTAFLQAQQLASAERWTDAADAYAQFYREFPRSEHAPDALYNSALYYEKGGKADKANGVYEQFVNRYPDDPKSERVYFFIAENYEATFQLERAVDYYQRLATRFPNSANGAAALYNSAFLKIGLRDYMGAAQAFEEYARRFPQEADRERVHFLAGEQYEQVDKARAQRFYESYLDQYGYQNPDNALEAMWRIAEIERQKGNTRQFEARRAEIVKAFDQIVASGKPIGPKGNKYAAEAAFPTVVAAWTAYSKDKMTGNEEKDLKLIERKKEEVKQIQTELDNFVNKYASFEHRSGALYYKAMAPLYLADLGLSIVPPKSMNEDDAAMYFEVLEQKVYPLFYAFEDAGVTRLKELVDAAKAAKAHSRWVDEAVAEMNRRKPADYPAVKRELVGQTDSSIPPRLVPVAIETPKAPPVTAAQDPGAGTPPPAPGPGETDLGTGQPTGGTPTPAPVPAPAPAGGGQ